MKKKLITLLTITAMIASGTAAIAANEPAEATMPPAEVNTISADEAVSSKPVSMPSYISNTVTVSAELKDNIIETKSDDAEDNGFDNIINLTVDESTLIYDNAGNKKSIDDVKKGEKITVFTGSYEPTVLMLPRQYKANVIILNSEEAKFVDVDTYITDGEEVTNAAFTLSVGADENTKVVDTEDKAVENYSLSNKDLIVFYTASTRSIPAQTTAEKIVIIGENEIALNHIEAAKNEPAATAEPMATAEPTATVEPAAPVATPAPSVFDSVEPEDIKTNTNGITLYPLRQIAEKNGFTVTWDGELRAVMLNNGMYSLKIGENSYIKGKMMPEVLSAAPEIIDDLTYVPADFFTNILELN